jgi:glycerol-3-phosphate cytidylyltransferase
MNGNSMKESNLRKSESEVLKRIMGLKKQGKTIVFTNGVFDIIHPGHIKLLKKSKSFGDILVVGLNTDKSVKINKGDKRPIFPFEERKKLLLAIEFVDFVIGFNEKTPINLISKIIPDILVKGGDYKPEEIVGREIVEKNGGKLILINLISEYSTSKIIENCLK